MSECKLRPVRKLSQQEKFDVKGWIRAVAVAGERRRRVWQIPLKHS